MPLAPYKDRTIKLTLENDFFSQNQQGNLVGSFSPSFVDQFLPTTGLTGAAVNALRGKQNSLILRGPTMLDVDLVADVADEPGLFTTFLQPWFIKNIPIRIHGESYLGIFEGLSVPDNDAPDSLRLFFTALRDFSNHLGISGTRERTILEIANNPTGSTRFIGFVRRFHFSEAVNKPYILDYDIEFIGKSLDDISIGVGKKSAQDASKLFSGIPLGTL